MSDNALKALAKKYRLHKDHGVKNRLMYRAAMIELEARERLKKRKNKNPRIRAKPFRPFGHLSTEKLENKMRELTGKLDLEVIVNRPDRITTKQEKKWLKVFDEIGAEIMRRDIEEFERK